MKIPKYIQGMNLYESCDELYIFRLQGKYRYGRNLHLHTDLEKLLNWASKKHANIKVVRSHERVLRSERKSGCHVDYYDLFISDPVALYLEREIIRGKISTYKKEQ